MKRFKVAAYGELLWDVLPNGMVLGGAPFNFAFRVNQLGDLGLTISRVGQDELGLKALEQVKARGVSVDHIQLDAEHPTGTVRVHLDEHQSPDFFIVPRVAYDYIAYDQKLEALARSADCVCFGTLIQRGDQSRQTLEAVLSASPQALKFLDINLRRDCYTPEAVRCSLEMADILKLNESELQEVGEIVGLSPGSVPDVSARLRYVWSLDTVVVTLGERGVYAVRKSGDAVYVPGYRVEVADSVGSGDAFSAGFLHVRLRSGGFREACELGNRMGALVATQSGGTTPFDLEDLAAFDEKHRERIAEPTLKKYAG